LASAWEARRFAGHIGFYCALDNVHIADLAVGLALLVGNQASLFTAMIAGLFAQLGNLAIFAMPTLATNRAEVPQRSEHLLGPRAERMMRPPRFLGDNSAEFSEFPPPSHPSNLVGGSRISHRFRDARAAEINIS
jgi:hypothetical protein